MLSKIKNIGKKVLFYSAFAAPLFFGCEDYFPTPGDGVDSNKDIIIPAENTIILSKNELNKMENISSDTIQYSSASDFHKGDILTSGITGKTPYGLMKKIESIEGNNIITSNASLEDVVLYGNVHFERELTENDLSNASLKSTNNNYNFCKKIDHILYDHDNDTTTTDDQIRAVGQFEFNAAIYADANFKNGFQDGYVKTTIDGRLELKTHYGINKDIDEHLKLFELNFNPFMVSASPPIIMTPKIEGVVGINGNVDGDFTLEAYGQAYLMGKVSYKKGEGWSSDFVKNLHFEVDQEINCTAEAKAYVAAKSTLTTNGVLGAFTEVEEYIRADADINENPWLSLYTGINLNMGVNAGFFSSFIPEYKKNLINNETLNIELYQNPNTYIDTRDNQRYKTIRIGNQIWFKDNLNYHTPNSTYYNHDKSNSSGGRLYFSKDLEKSCPPGWRIPNDNDWKELVYNFEGYPNCNEDDITGFGYLYEELNSLGFCENAGTYISIDNIGFVGKDDINGIWLSPKVNKDNQVVVPYRVLNDKFDYISTGSQKTDNEFMFSIRPMKDAD